MFRSRGGAEPRMRPATAYVVDWRSPFYPRMPASSGPRMNARLERKLRLLVSVVAVGAVLAIVSNIAQGRTSSSSIVAAILYGLLMGAAIGGVELFILGGPMRVWLGGLSFIANLIVRSTIYAAIIILIQWLQPG